MKRIGLDFGTCSTEQEVHAYLKEQFAFPDHYGGNLDALYDCLTDLAEDIEICFEEERGDACREAAPEAKGPTAERIQQYLKKVRRVIGDAAEENSHLYL